MPWKNGGGSTLELICLHHPQTSDILFRLSSATVSQSGPFSQFAGIDRHLFLMDGDGFILKFPDKEVTMDKLHEVHIFRGEEEIHCQLLGPQCVDFNVMTNRTYGSSQLFITQFGNGRNFKCHADKSFLYFPHSKELIILSRGESYTHQDAYQTVYLIDLTTH